MMLDRRMHLLRTRPLNPMRRRSHRDAMSVHDENQLRQPRGLPGLPAPPQNTRAACFALCLMENEAVLDRTATRLAQRLGILDRRRETVEHPFSSIKQLMYQRAFLVRGPEKVRGEFSLTALAELMAAVQAMSG